MLLEHTARIRALNDHLRQGRTSGRIHVTSGVVSLGNEALKKVLRLVAEFDDFSPQNDPYGEHDFGAFQFEGSQIFWKIDYYDLAFGGAALDAADETRCRRVLTIMLAEEY